MPAWWRPSLVLSATALLACGGESRAYRNSPVEGSPAGGASLGTPGLGGSGALPTKDGIPVGDCTEPTPSQQADAGCSVPQPVGSPCDVQGAACRYSIETSQELASALQNYSVCLDGRWFATTERCSETCRAARDLVETTFDTSDCEARPELACNPGMFGDDQTSPPLSAQVLMDEELEALLATCGLLDAPGPDVEVDFENGCPSALGVLASLDPTVVACLVANLAGARYGCARLLPCSHWNRTIE